MVIEVCKKEDKEKLIEFLHDYWKEDHILVNSQEIMEWQHGNSDGGLNFMIAKDDNNNILAIYGFIPQSHFDSNIPNKYGYNESWGAIWKIRPDCKVPGLGVLVLRKVFAMYDFVSGIGLSDMSKKIYQSMRCEMHNMNQYYVLNPTIEEFKIAKILKKPNAERCIANDNVQLHQLDSLAGLSLVHSYHPIKTITFLINRYQRHPVYKYKFIGCYNINQLLAILVYREIEIDNRKCWRIVDVYGSLENVKGLGFALTKYIEQHPTVEYVDLYNYGIDKNIFVGQGFKEVVYEIGENVIPNYFEPFVQKSIDLQFFYLSKDRDMKYVLFKGDSDQDRPNFIR